MDERAVNKTCDGCRKELKFVHGQARCIDKECPLYWKGQGGIETLVPLEPPTPLSQPTAAVVVTEPPEV